MPKLTKSEILKHEAYIDAKKYCQEGVKGGSHAYQVVAYSLRDLKEKLGDQGQEAVKLLAEEIPEIHNIVKIED